MMIVKVLILLAILAIAWIVIDWLKVPDPLNRIVKIVIVVLVAIEAILALTGHGGYIRIG
jgi:hypothetical protein